MWKSNRSGSSPRPKRKLNDWLFLVAFFTGGVVLAFNGPQAEKFFVWVLQFLFDRPAAVKFSVLAAEQPFDYRALLTPDGADALIVVTILLIVVAVLAFLSPCIMAMLSFLARRFRIEQHRVTKAMISAVDAIDISSSQEAARFVGRCRAAFRGVKNPAYYSELGAIGNMKAALARSQEAIERRPAAQGRQAGVAPANRSKAGSKSCNDDGDGGGDGEPPRQRFYTYAAFAKLFGVAPQTLRNKVSAGQFPAPVRTAFGPRFTQQHVDYAVNPPRQTDGSSPRRRGRPRIAGSQGGGL
jgi:hypothetical protein